MRADVGGGGYERHCELAEADALEILRKKLKQSLPALSNMAPTSHMWLGKFKLVKILKVKNAISLVILATFQVLIMARCGQWLSCRTARLQNFPSV